MVSEFMKAQEFDFESHEKVRNKFTWGSYGKSQELELQINLLKNLSDNHIFNILRTQNIDRSTSLMFITELCYRIEEGRGV